MNELLLFTVHRSQFTVLFPGVNSDPVSFRIPELGYKTILADARLGHEDLPTVGRGPVGIKGVKREK